MKDIMRAIDLKLNVDCGLHDFLSDDQEIAHLAARNGVVIRDVRKPPERNRLHFFSGDIETVEALLPYLLHQDAR